MSLTFSAALISCPTASTRWILRFVARDVIDIQQLLVTWALYIFWCRKSHARSKTQLYRFITFTAEVVLCVITQYRHYILCSTVDTIGGGVISSRIGRWPFHVSYQIEPPRYTSRRMCVRLAVKLKKYISAEISAGTKRFFATTHRQIGKQ